ncbi:MAG: GTPase HflX [Clostridiales bacterium]|nr:GTPase HflX [Clostridiales bacterium]
MSQVHGNITGIRDSQLAELEAIYDCPFELDEFAPRDLLLELARHSCALNREIAVYVSRDGDVLDVTVGVIDSVPLSDLRLRRNAKRLSFVRCIHTHPGGSARLSDVDLAALRSLMLDSMCAVGVNEQGQITGVSAAFLTEKVNGIPGVVESEIYPLKKLPQQGWMQEIALSEARVLQGDEGDLGENPERALLVGIDSEKSLDELAALAESAGAQVVGRVFQKRPKADTATFVGSGKAMELQLDAQAAEADVVIFDDELSGAQTRNLEEIIGVKVIDRTTLILDIFAQRAKSGEGKLQVQLAQLKYRAGRLIGQGLILSRLGGGIGTRGPGESKLEIDRRRIREQITALKRELDALQKQRQLRRKSREKNAVPIVSLVGYTNTGKSTLLNQITDAGVYAENKLFATLDAVSRKVQLPDGGEFLLVDTVGFISKLPHDLVEAFKSTLEEAALSDLLVIVSDASSPDMLFQHKVVEEVLSQIGADTQPRLNVLNKCDLCEEQVEGEIPLLPGAIRISAKTGQGVDALFGAIAMQLRKTEQKLTLLVPFAQYGAVAELRQKGRVVEETYEDTGTRVTVMLKQDAAGQIAAKYGSMILADEDA